MFVSLIVLTPILFSVSTPAYTAIMKDIYPDRLRGRLMSLVRVGMAASILIGQTVASLARNLIATALVIGVGLAIGWRPTASGPWRTCGRARPPWSGSGRN